MYSVKLEDFPDPCDRGSETVFALGGGCEISMSCDIRICSDNAVFGHPKWALASHPASAAHRDWQGS